MRLTEALELYNHRIANGYVFTHLSKEEVDLIKEIRPRKKSKKNEQKKEK